MNNWFHFTKVYEFGAHLLYQSAQNASRNSETTDSILQLLEKLNLKNKDLQTLEWMASGVNETSPMSEIRFY